MGNDPPISHLDLKPENILLRAGVPVVGDCGICFVDDNEVSITKEGPRGSIYYCAPELRNPKIPERTPLKAADVYSLGEIVYFIFTNDVYDGHEEEYGNDSTHQLVTLFPEYPQFAFVDELVAATVQRNPTERIPDATQLLKRVNRVINRIEAGGQVLDLRIAQRCLYCGEGKYRPAHELTSDSRGNPSDKFPKLEERRQASKFKHSIKPSPYDSLNSDAERIVGKIITNDNIAPLFLVCDFCGNVQHFRFDLTADRHGRNWKP